MKRKIVTTGIMVLLTILFNESFAQTTTNLGTSSGTSGNHNTNIGNETGLNNTGNWNTFIGSVAGKDNTTGNDNTFVGVSAGRFNTVGIRNTFVGRYSGFNHISGIQNTFMGYQSGYKNTEGSGNVFIGDGSGYSNTVGYYDVGIGTSAGRGNITGTRNTFIGPFSGQYCAADNEQNTLLGYASGHYIDGSFNTVLGSWAGKNATGDRNVLIGYEAGQSVTGGNKLVIHSVQNNASEPPLIYGEFDNQRLVFNAKVGINTQTFPTTVGTGSTAANVADYSLFVKGGILSEAVRVRTGWADYVFKPDYNLMPLNDVENFIETNGHLPNIPSATTIENSGLDLGEIARLQQEKIEELTLYLIQQQKEIKELKSSLLNKKP